MLHPKHKKIAVLYSLTGVAPNNLPNLFGQYTVFLFVSLFVFGGKFQYSFYRHDLTLKIPYFLI